METTSDAAAPFEGLLNNPLYAAFEKPITAGGFLKRDGSNQGRIRDAFSLLEEEEYVGNYACLRSTYSDLYAGRPSRTCTPPSRARR